MREKKQQKKLQLTQAYSRLYYTERIKPIILERWALHVENHPEDSDRQGPPLTFRNKVIKELYQQETAEVKAEVERCRNEDRFPEPDSDESDGDSDTEPDDDVDSEERQRRALALSYQECVPTLF